ncbi:MAG: sigma-70 family RNA polymerase sigma factor [Dehalococcoidales bacterium]|nr:sigma-70 family RNA polymerase sigma factor [Dehalococcoidales bacterium]
MRRAVAGEAEAFACLYDLHLTRVYRYVYYQVGNRADAEDLAQQVFLQAWRAIRSYKPGKSPFIAWLFTVAHNAVVSFRRKAKEVTPLQVEPRADRGGVDPEEAALAGHSRETVRRAVLSLRPDWQQVILLRFVGQFDHGEIAAALGKSEGNIRVIQHRALAELRRVLEREVHDR